MKILVTGSSGFIGSHLIDALKVLNIQYIPLDLKTGQDLRDKATVQSLASKADAIIHLGAIASVQKSIEDPDGTFATNVIGTRNVYEAAVDAGNIPVIYASSAAVYGDNNNLPLKESERPNPLSPYARHKLQNEIDAKEFGAQYGLKTFGLRFFNIYGTGQDPASPYSGVISVFYDRLSKGLPITIYGDGQQSRDFVAAPDAAQALIQALSHANDKGPVNNICTNTPVTLMELLDIMARNAVQPPDIQFKPARTGDIRHSCGDPKAFENITGFKPSTNLPDGLKILFSGP